MCCVVQSTLVCRKKMSMKFLNYFDLGSGGVVQYRTSLSSTKSTGNNELENSKVPQNTEWTREKTVISMPETTIGY